MLFRRNRAEGQDIALPVPTQGEACDHAEATTAPVDLATMFQTTEAPIVPGTSFGTIGSVKLNQSSSNKTQRRFRHDQKEKDDRVVQELKAAVGCTSTWVWVKPDEDAATSTNDDASEAAATPTTADGASPSVALSRKERRQLRKHQEMAQTKQLVEAEYLVVGTPKQTPTKGGTDEHNEHDPHQQPQQGGFLSSLLGW